MKTILLTQPGQFALTETPPPKPQDGQALVRVRRVGICGTDLHAFRGRQPFFTYPRILGHELGVEVVDVPPNDRGLRPGDRCVVEPYLNCGHCIACRGGKTNCCANLRVLGVHLDGGMREYLPVPVEKLHKSERLSLEQLALVETLAIGYHAVGRARPEPEETVAVVGVGPIGLGVIQFALLAGARVIALDVSPRRLEFCRRAFGLEHVLDARENPLDALKTLTEGDLPTLVFDATGNPKAMERSLFYAANGGRVVFVGLVEANITFPDPEFHRRELTLYATRNATAHDFRRVLELLESGRVDSTTWITHRVDADTMIPAFPTWLEPESGTVKAIVAF